MNRSKVFPSSLRLHRQIGWSRAALRAPVRQFWRGSTPRRAGTFARAKCRTVEVDRLPHSRSEDDRHDEQSDQQHTRTLTMIDGQCGRYGVV
jgi:hypothetical protein